MPTCSSQHSQPKSSLFVKGPPEETLLAPIKSTNNVTNAKMLETMLTHCRSKIFASSETALNPVCKKDVLVIVPEMSSISFENPPLRDVTVQAVFDDGVITVPSFVIKLTPHELDILGKDFRKVSVMVRLDINMNVDEKNNILAPSESLCSSVDLNPSTNILHPDHKTVPSHLLNLPWMSYKEDLSSDSDVADIVDVMTESGDFVLMESCRRPDGKLESESTRVRDCYVAVEGTGSDNFCDNNLNDDISDFDSFSDNDNHSGIRQSLQQYDHNYSKLPLPDVHCGCGKRIIRAKTFKQWPCISSSEYEYEFDDDNIILRQTKVANVKTLKDLKQSDSNEGTQSGRNSPLEGVTVKKAWEKSDNSDHADSDKSFHLSGTLSSEEDNVSVKKIKKKSKKSDSDKSYQPSEHSSSVWEDSSSDEDEDGTRVKADRSLAVHCHICQQSNFSRKALMCHMFLKHGMYNKDPENRNSSENQTYDFVVVDVEQSRILQNQHTTESDIESPMTQPNISYPYDVVTTSNADISVADDGLITRNRQNFDSNCTFNDSDGATDCKKVQKSNVSIETNQEDATARKTLEILTLSPHKFRCPICVVTLGTVCQIKHHIYKKHLLKSLEKRDNILCPDCGKILAFGYLRVHLEIAHGRPDESVMCNICGKLCPGKINLGVHIRRHGRLYRCDQCTKTFADKRTLVAHIKGHGKIKDFVCKWPECGRRFASKWSLHVHSRRHTGEKPLRCDRCGYSCIQRNALNFHQKSVHRRD